MDETPNARRNLGAHYTTEENILNPARKQQSNPIMTRFLDDETRTSITVRYYTHFLHAAGH